MKLEEIKKIGVAGAGTMGAGIAQVFAMYGYEVVLYDLNTEMLKKGESGIVKNLDGAISRGKLTEEAKAEVLDKIKYSAKVEDLVGDLLIEAIVEKLEIKKELFTQLTQQNGEEAIMATNTSSIPITQIAYGQKNPERFVGMHFFNPAHIMKLVEVISGVATLESFAKLVFDLSLKIGKQPVMAKDAPGFIVNRVARHFYVESLKVLEERVADVETIDNLIKNLGFKMGPFELMDLIGVDANFNVTNSVYEQFMNDSKFRPSRIQKQLVDAGYHGRKTGKGFYDYQ